MSLFSYFILFILFTVSISIVASILCLGRLLEILLLDKFFLSNGGGVLYNWDILHPPVLYIYLHKVFLFLIVGRNHHITSATKKNGFLMTEKIKDEFFWEFYSSGGSIWTLDYVPYSYKALSIINVKLCSL